jgi:hypothetical protein
MPPMRSAGRNSWRGRRGARAALWGALVLAACADDVEEVPDWPDAGGPPLVDAGGSAALAADAASATPVLDASVAIESGVAMTQDAGAPRTDASPAAARDAGDGSAPDASDATTARDASPARDASGSGDAGSSCSGSGQITYMLARSATPTADQSSAYGLITMAMDGAVSRYNCYTDVTRSLRVSYDPAVPTADGNVNGAIRFGARGNMNLAAAMHEIAHVLGVGANEFRAKVQNGVFTGARATAQLREITGKADDVVHSDGTHFWPNGLNYPSEFKSEADAVNHCKMVVAIRADLGL